MIDTDKYEGHTKGDNEVGWRILGDNFVVNDKSPNNRFIAYAQVNNDGGHTIVGFSDADANLIADAPLLLAEVKRLRERLIRAYDWAEKAVNGNDSAMMDYTEYVCGGEEE
tara:strand:- start:1330 stop:1662 length:333 start_codon:yes stop_codon:yes gene_type:complete